MVSTQFDSDKSSCENNVVSMSRLIAQDAIRARGRSRVEVGLPTDVILDTHNLEDGRTGC
jgi:hypothetical protein